MKLTKSQLREIIRKELQSLKEAVTLDTFKDLAKTSNSASDFIKKARDIKNVPAAVADEFFEKYGKGGSLSMDKTAEIFWKKYRK